jgi:hypothetical protein
MNGFILIRGDSARLDEVMASDEWIKNVMRAQMHLQGAGAVRGVCGDLIGERMAMWRNLIPG